LTHKLIVGHPAAGPTDQYLGTEPVQYKYREKALPERTGWFRVARAHSAKFSGGGFSRMSGETGVVFRLI